MKTKKPQSKARATVKKLTGKMLAALVAKAMAKRKDDALAARARVAALPLGHPDRPLLCATMKRDADGRLEYDIEALKRDSEGHPDHMRRYLYLSDHYAQKNKRVADGRNKSLEVRKDKSLLFIKEIQAIMAKMKKPSERGACARYATKHDLSLEKVRNCYRAAMKPAKK
jgi:hypothetical protein